jgi:nudix-type nucleoside diphosphatase (YffH/AdpP family)
MSNEDTDVTLVETKTLAKHKGTLTETTYERVRSDGDRQTAKREIYDNGCSAAILPYDRKRGMVLLTRQFRLPAFLQDGAHFLIEACAGKLEGDDPAVRIVKEVNEELGYRIASPKKVYEVFMSPADFMEKITLFVGQYRPDDKISEGGGLADEGEDVTVLEVPLVEAFAMVRAGTIIDAKTIILLQYLQMERSAA